jgi:hypothetical protein
MYNARMCGKYKFIGCEIIYREACHLAATSPHRVDLEFLLKGLHDLPRADMQGRIQAAIDAVDPQGGYEAILLGYARCNDGLVGVRARDIPLVIPRAHDCITFLFGGRDAFDQYFNANAGTFYTSTGWIERDKFDTMPSLPAYGRRGVMANLGLDLSYEEMVEKYGAENAAFILQSLGDWRKNYSRCLYLEMGVCDEAACMQTARRRAQDNNWAFSAQKGSLELLRKLFAGQWDDDFVIVPPGGSIVARNDKRILDSEPPPASEGGKMQ